MALSDYQWWEVTTDYIQVKFTHTLDSDTLINANITLYDDAATPNVIVSPFDTIEVAKDYSSISRLLTLWWSPGLDLDSGNYELRFTNLETFLGVDIAPFSFVFEWVAGTATANPLLRPDRTPVEVEDYSIKTPGWSIVETTTPTTEGDSGLVKIIDLLPGVSTHHNLQTSDNEGKIDILFDNPIASNYISPYYFILNYKEIKQGISTWNALPTYIVSNLDSTMVTIYLPAVEGLESATPSYIYSINLAAIDILNYTFFASQTKYKLIISTEVGL